ncbi:uncharacterized protein LOC121980598 isoform X1 [Zingiber officinale]|uniref:uncharacterized protein LOC121980598 isoform X1 n=1 Tax=Zingiber officinale TaxID=94328 RepID=UPI001C4D89CB|nr:uncharacterized protein LOC121980598 isoform X1 [Zingiber officinale]
MATTEASGDDDEWARQAYHNPDLVAAVLISFRLWCPEADGDERPSTSAPPSVCSLEWGTRRKRSRLQIPRVFPLTQEEEEEERKISAATAEAEAEETNRKEKKRRASPQSPLEGYSSASASGGEEGAKTGRSAGVSIAGPEERRNEQVVAAAVAATNPREPTVSCFIRLPPQKKMTKVELQAVQTSLLEEKAKLVEEMEIWRKSLEQLRAENGKLKSLRKLPEPPVNNHHTIKAVQQLVAPGRKDFIELPDLNDLPTDC